MSFVGCFSFTEADQDFNQDVQISLGRWANVMKSEISFFWVVDFPVPNYGRKNLTDLCKIAVFC